MTYQQLIGNYASGTVKEHGVTFTRQGVVVYVDSEYAVLRGEVGCYICEPDVTVVPDSNLFGSALDHVRRVREHMGL